MEGRRTIHGSDREAASAVQLNRLLKFRDLRADGRNKIRIDAVDQVLLLVAAKNGAMKNRSFIAVDILDEPFDRCKWQYAMNHEGAPDVGRGCVVANSPILSILALFPVPVTIERDGNA